MIVMQAASKKPCQELAQWITTICDHFCRVCARVAECHNETRDGDAAKEKIRVSTVAFILIVTLYASFHASIVALYCNTSFCVHV